MKYKKIEFSSTLNFGSPIASAKKFIPKWYKDSEKFIGGNPIIEQYSVNKGLKLCMPFLDSLTSGYIIFLWTDIQVRQTDDGPKFTWLSNPGPINSDTPQNVIKNIPIPAGHSPHHFSWVLPTYLEMPDGYSAIFTHPFNRYDLPFTSLTGVVDMGKDKTMFPGQFPFFLKEGFEGIISEGTPIAQVIPFKDESWKLVENKELKEKGNKLFYNSRRVTSGFYRNFAWKKKEYL